MTGQAFLDSNVLIDALRGSHADHHTRARSLLDRATQGQIQLHISSTVLLETAFVLTRTHSVPRRFVVDAFRVLLELPSVRSHEIDVLRQSIDLWEQESPLSFADCYHLVLARSLGLDSIYSFDRKMGRYPGFQRVEP